MTNKQNSRREFFKKASVTGIAFCYPSFATRDWLFGICNALNLNRYQIVFSEIQFLNK